MPGESVSEEINVRIQFRNLLIQCKMQVVSHIIKLDFYDKSLIYFKEIFKPFTLHCERNFIKFIKVLEMLFISVRDTVCHMNCIS